MLLPLWDLMNGAHEEQFEDGCENKVLHWKDQILRRPTFKLLCWHDEISRYWLNGRVHVVLCLWILRIFLCHVACLDSRKLFNFVIWRFHQWRNTNYFSHCTFAVSFFEVRTVAVQVTKRSMKFTILLKSLDIWLHCLCFFLSNSCNL